MRHRNIKGLNYQVLNDMGVITSPVLLDEYNNIHLEIGSGKGNFITTLALDNPDITFVALEKNINVCYRLAQKVNELKLENVIIILDDSLNLLNYFNKRVVIKLYLNFSDPWPKARHHKRRLTYPNFLEIYIKIMKENSIIQFRTDHLNLFNDSIEYMEKYFNLTNINYNYISNKYYTEYEVKRIEKGNLYQLEGMIKDEYL